MIFMRDVKILVPWDGVFAVIFFKTSHSVFAVYWIIKES